MGVLPIIPYWQALSIIDIMVAFQNQWAILPNDWVGLWKILNNINIPSYWTRLVVERAQLIKYNLQIKIRLREQANNVYLT